MFIRSFLILLLSVVSLFAAPQAVVFDFGGVMIHNPNRAMVVDFLCHSLHLTKKEFQKLDSERENSSQPNPTEFEFWLQVANSRNITLPSTWVEDFKNVTRQALGVSQEMYLLVNQLKHKHIPIVLLSNSNERFSKVLREFGLYEPFDICLFSFEIGAKKPDPKAYEATLKVLNLPAQEVVFIDDTLENVEVAKKLGFDAILFKSPKQLQEELKKRDLF